MLMMFGEKSTSIAYSAPSHVNGTHRARVIMAIQRIDDKQVFLKMALFIVRAPFILLVDSSVEKQ
jgi:hypothetical protein